MEDHNQELEAFRQQWKEEVTARHRRQPSQADEPGSSLAGPSRASTNDHFNARPLPDVKIFREDGYVRNFNFDNLDQSEDARRLGTKGIGLHPESQKEKEPETALEHYEKAVDKEAQGNLGDSLTHYRKAYKLDDRVDQKYKNKHFPPSSFLKPSNTNPSNASPTVPNPAHHSLQGPSHGRGSSLSELVSSFSHLALMPTEPLNSGTPAPPCPIAFTPPELLSEIFLYIAITDVAAFNRLALVGKRFAYIVATEDQIWKRLCYGSEFGLGAMHYSFACSIDGAKPTSYPSPLQLHLPLSSTYTTYAFMFHNRPRIRFSGVYISTVNYSRPGGSSANQVVTWSTPIHIVTYYRYLRFYRDGTLISLLTTHDPQEVVPHLHTSNLPKASTPLSTIPPYSIMKNALRGRWKLSHPFDPSLPSSTSPEPPSTPFPGVDPNQRESEGSVHIETLGVTSAYTYNLHLSLASGGGKHAPKNTKLLWKGFWSYNKLTDDWAEFQLRNDKPFVWSRVRSWADS